MSIHSDHITDHRDAMTLLYMTMVGIDGKQDVREFESARTCLMEWGMSSEDIQNSLSNCQAFYAAGGSTPDALIYVCDLIKNGVTEGSRKSVVKDLARIAYSDEDVDQSEAMLIGVIATQLEVDLNELAGN